MFIYHPGICPQLPDGYNETHNFAVWEPQYHSYCPGGLSPYMTYAHQFVGEFFDQVAGHIVSMFRQPEQKIMSAWTNCMASPGWECGTPLDFARQAQGQTTRYLIFPAKKDATRADLWDLAKKRLNEGFAFVGLTEQWDLSVCLFHAKFGGPCSAIQLMDVDPTAAKNGTFYDTSGLQGWVDRQDGKVYAEAQRIFAEDSVRFQVSEASCAQWCWSGL